MSARVEVSELDPAVAARLTRNADGLVVISDFLGEARNAEAAMRLAAAAGAEVFAVHVVADEELDPPERTFMATDPERSDVRRAMSEAEPGGQVGPVGQVGQMGDGA